MQQVYAWRKICLKPELCPDSNSRDRLGRKGNYQVRLPKVYKKGLFERPFFVL